MNRAAMVNMIFGGEGTGLSKTAVEPTSPTTSSCSDDDSSLYGVSSDDSSRLLTPSSRMTLPMLRRSRSPKKARLVQHVKFDDNLTIHEPADVEEDENDINRLWYSKKDLKKFRENNAHVCRILNSSDRANDQSYLNIVKSTFESCRKGSHKDIDHEALHQNCSLWYFRAGLSRYAIRPILRDSKARRERLLYLVINLPHQTKARKQTPDAIAEQLRKACSAVSLPSRRFACYMAQAHQI